MLHELLALLHRRFLEWSRSTAGPPRILSELFLLILQLYEQIWRYLEVAQNFYFELAQGDRNSRMESCPWLRLLLALGTLATQYLAHNLDTEHLVKLLGETHGTQHLIWHTLLCTSICYIYTTGNNFLTQTVCQLKILFTASPHYQRNNSATPLRFRKQSCAK